MHLILFMSALSLTAMETDVAEDEVLQFYPTVATQADDGRSWKVPIHGIVYEPSKGGLKDQAVLLVFRKFAGIDGEQAATPLFQNRAKTFLVDNQRRCEVFIRLGEQTHAAGKSEANGHFETTLSLTNDEVAALRRRPEWNHDTLTCGAVFGLNDRRQVSARVSFLNATGLSIISDLDDTIKVTNVADRKAVVQNTFTKEFEAVPGMADIYRRWAEQGAAFHYVTASPWQLFAPLEEFREKSKFPAGEWRMKLFRWKDSTALDMLGSQVEYKTNVIEPMLKEMPKRRFVCVGDTGEQDPEIYGALARKHPDQIAKIIIRDLTETGIAPERLKAAFADLPADKWLTFRSADELRTAELIPQTK